MRHHWIKHVVSQSCGSRSRIQNAGIRWLPSDTLAVVIQRNDMLGLMEQYGIYPHEMYKRDVDATEPEKEKGVLDIMKEHGMY